MTEQRKNLVTASCCLLLGLADLAVLNVWLAPQVWPATDGAKDRSAARPRLAEATPSASEDSSPGRKATERDASGSEDQATAPQKLSPTLSEAERGVLGEAAPPVLDERTKPPAGKIAALPVPPAGEEARAELPRPSDTQAESMQPRPRQQPSGVLDEIVVRFEPGVCFLQAEAAVALVGKLRRLDGDDLWIEVEGHADRTGNPDGNVKIAELRAGGIGKLLARHGYRADKITIVGYGSARPVDARNNAEAWARNRRVVIRIHRR